MCSCVPGECCVSDVMRRCFVAVVFLFCYSHTIITPPRPPPSNAALPKTHTNTLPSHLRSTLATTLNSWRKLICWCRHRRVRKATCPLLVVMGNLNLPSIHYWCKCTNSKMAMRISRNRGGSRHPRMGIPAIMECNDDAEAHHC